MKLSFVFYQNTNVVELHSRVLVDPCAEQLTYYNCGIGTYVPNRRKTFKYWRQRIDNIVDLAIAWYVLWTWTDMRQ
jgi:uncharacterized protein (DUF2235 family)